MTNESQPHHWNAELYDGKHAYVFGYGAQVVELLAPQPGERIIDLGCGTGHLTAAIAEAGSQVLGLDHSAEMIAKARANYPQLRFEVCDARDFSVDEPQDAVFSNAALHWVLEADRVVARVAAALRPGGRFVAEFGGKGNVRQIIGAVGAVLKEMGIAPGPVDGLWYFPSIAEYSQLLERHGLEVTWAALMDRPTTLEDGEAGLRNWLKMFAEQVLAAVPSARLEKFFSRMESRLRVQLYGNGAWHADYRRIRVVAVKAG